MPYSLLLASASPARAATLRSAHIRHCSTVSHVDEDALLAAAKANGTPSAAAQVALLAAAKARDVAALLRQAPPSDSTPNVRVVVGCDSMFEMDGEVVGKPHTAAVARKRLRKMSGRSGTLYTGHCLIDIAHPERPEASGVSKAIVHIAPLSDADIEAYIASGEPLKVAGSFTIDGRGGPFVERIEGDHHGVVGISLPLLRELLAQLDYSITDFWE